MDVGVVSGALLACVATVASVLAVRSFVMAPREAALDRVRRATQASDETGAPSREATEVIATVLSPLAAIARPKAQSEDLSRIRQRLLHAGVRQEHALEIFFGSKVALALLLGGIVLVLDAFSARGVSHAKSLAVIAVAVGFYLPNVWLARRVRARQTALSRALPDALDLLVTCVEAGLGLDAALERIAHELAPAAPELAFELRQATLEARAGVPRPETFRRLAERTGLEELRALSAMIIQTEIFGTPLAKALRTHSSSMRVRRSHQAEERGAAASVKMMIPLITCILPSLLCIVLGPAVVRIATLLAPALAGSH